MEEAEDGCMPENLKFRATCVEVFGAGSNIQKARNGIFRSCTKRQFFSLASDLCVCGDNTIQTTKKVIVRA